MWTAGVWVDVGSGRIFLPLAFVGGVEGKGRAEGGEQREGGGSEEGKFRVGLVWENARTPEMASRCLKITLGQGCAPANDGPCLHAPSTSPEMWR